MKGIILAGGAGTVDGIFDVRILYVLWKQDNLYRLPNWRK